MGGNVGDRLFYLHQAALSLDESCGKTSERSPVYETAAWGNTEQPAFLNQAIGLHTPYSPRELMDALLQLEERLGRKRGEKYGPRTIDLDILLFNNDIYRSEGLIIPHAELHNRMFALKPLADIAGEASHPVLNQTISGLLAACKDDLPVKRLAEK